MKIAVTIRDYHRFLLLPLPLPLPVTAPYAGRPVLCGMFTASCILVLDDEFQIRRALKNALREVADRVVTEPGVGYRLELP